MQIQSNVLYFVQNFNLQFVPEAPLDNNSIGPGNGLVSIRHQAITWTKCDQIL